jgi:hypothetical protein
MSKMQVSFVNKAPVLYNLETGLGPVKKMSLIVQEYGQLPFGQYSFCF